MAGITPQQLRRYTELAEEGRSNVGIGTWVGRSLDEVYNALTGYTADECLRLDPASVWDENGFYYDPTEGHEWPTALSRGVFRYPVASFQGHFITNTASGTPGSRRQFLGLGGQNASHPDWGSIPSDYYGILLFEGTGFITAGACLGTVNDSWQLPPLPASYDSNYNWRWYISLFKGLMEVSCCCEPLDIRKILGFVLGNNSRVPTHEGTAPYTIASQRVTNGIPAANNLKIAFHWDTEEYLPIPPHRTNIIEGEASPPRQYQFYTEDTANQWSNLATGGNKLTSHPVPIVSWRNKTVCFEADAAGTLQVQVYMGIAGDGGKWVDINAPGGVAVVANQPYIYQIEGEYPVCRLIYDPTNGDTIAYAHVNLF